MWIDSVVFPGMKIQVTDPQPPRASDLSCTLRRERLEIVECPECPSQPNGAKKRVQLYACSFHGKCVLSNPYIPGAKSCDQCAERVPDQKKTPSKLTTVVGDEITINFRHGLGDATNFAHMIPLYTRRGYTVKVQSGHADHATIFRAGGAEVIGDNAQVHPWGEPPKGPFGPWADPWPHNKNGWNLSRAPLPKIGEPWELWDEYCAVKLDFEPQVTAGDRAAIDLLIQGASRPLIAMHVKGFGWGKHRNYPDDMTQELQRRLLDQTPGTLIMLDRDKQAAHLNAARVAYFRDFGPGQLYELLRRVDMLIGIDSGPLNFVRFTDTPAIGIWNAHYPSDYFLPRENTVHVVASHHRERDKYERGRWNTILAPDDGPAPDFLAQTSLRILTGAQRLKTIARDVQLQHFIDLADLPEHGAQNHGLVDGKGRRCLGRALAFLATRTNPVVVETGTIRHQEDWAGAGFSTYLFGAFLAKHGGQLHSVDLTPAYVQFARSWTKEFGCVTVHEAHSHQCLETWTGGKIDLFYADSADIGTPGFHECCLGEIQRAQKLLAGDARILIDDTLFANGAWQGKGALAVPWLLANGWQVECSGWQVFLKKV